MDRNELRALLQRVAEGATGVDQAVARIAAAPVDDLGFAKVDLHRSQRQGATEVIYGEGKTAEQIAAIASSLLRAGQGPVLATRVDPPKADEVRLAFSLREGEGGFGSPDGFDGVPVRYDDTSRILLLGELPVPKPESFLVVACAGTSDLPVAEEAAITAEALGSRVERLYDVGVAGIHRLLSCGDMLASARCVVAVAGMEGALASVIGGLVSCPVVAVPTSVGYGASFNGLAALLSMLNSCASGVSVVNIDNGFGAGYLAHMIDCPCASPASDDGVSERTAL